MITQVTINGKTIPVLAQKVKGQIWIHFNGRTFQYEDESKKKFGSQSSQTGHAGDILAPMPGKVTKILKQAGDSVSKGEAVIVMEAMKMEYTLKSDGDGVIQKIGCKLGEQVSLGKVLAHIDPKKEGQA
ncbi:MAG: hypothetical protein BroJett040_12960 [Oligoflexia bacterium]|nr:MAG: hypothetical protein BroJett040_12960 [Oligoflexia bacterium]